MTQEQQRYARFLCSQRQTAAGGQVQFAHRAPAFHDYGPQRSAAQGIDASSQQSHGIGHDPQQPKPRRAAQFGPTIGLQYPTQMGDPLYPQPQYRPFRIGHAHCHAHGKSCRAG